MKEAIRKIKKTLVAQEYWMFRLSAILYIPYLLTMTINFAKETGSWFLPLIIVSTALVAVTCIGVCKIGILSVWALPYTVMTACLCVSDYVLFSDYWQLADTSEFYGTTISLLTLTKYSAYGLVPAVGIAAVVTAFNRVMGKRR